MGAESLEHGQRAHEQSQADTQPCPTTVTIGAPNGNYGEDSPKTLPNPKPPLPRIRCVHRNTDQGGLLITAFIAALLLAAEDWHRECE
jgi:hypothetical protein